MKLKYASTIQEQYLNKIRKHALTYIGGTSKFCEYLCRSGEMANDNTYVNWYKTYRERRKFAIQYLGGKCVICGEFLKLEFDHIDPSTKSKSIDQCLMLSMDKLKAELDKCQLLCEAHHKEKSDLEKRKIYCSKGHLRNNKPGEDRHCLTCKRSMNIVYKRRYNNKKKHARLIQQAEIEVLKTSKSGFESQDGHTNENTLEASKNPWIKHVHKNALGCYESWKTIYESQSNEKDR